MPTQSQGHSKRKGPRKAESSEAESYRFLFDTMLQGVVLQDRNGKIVSVNPAAETILGKPASELIGQNAESPELTTVREDGSPYPVAEHPAIVALRTGKVVRNSATRILNAKENRYRWYSLTAVPLFQEGADAPSGAYTIIDDITERKEMEQAREASEKSYTSIVQAAPWGMHFYELKDNGRLEFVGANPAADKILKIDHKQLIGMTLEEAFPANAGKEIAEAYRRVARSGEPWRSERVDYADGRIQGAFAVHAFRVSNGRMVAAFSDITERARNEENTRKLLAEMRQEKERLSLLMDSMTDEVWFADTSGKFILANGAALKAFGVDPSATGVGVVNMAEGLEVMRLDGSIRPPEDAPPLRALKGEVVNNEDEIVRIPRTGRLSYRRVNATPVRDADGKIIGSVSVVRDVTVLKSSENELRRTRDYLESLFDYANAPIIVWDPSFKITRFNHAFEHMTGYSANEVIGKDLSILFPLESREDSLAKIKQTLTGLYWESVEIPILRKDGGVRMALWNSANIHAEDRKTLIATIAQGQDITERKEGELRLKGYSDDLARSNAELQSFAYVASHDLREPLRTIASFLEILKMDYGDKLDAQARDHIERTVRASKRLHDMIDDLLSFSRLETRKKAFTEVDLKDVLVLAERDLNATITEHGAKVSAESLPVVSADDQQMVILFRNLIDNAVKFHGSEPPKVKIEAKRRKDEWLISVKDNGIGVDQANFNKIFDMFVRLHSWKDYPGNGIGLSMCKKIVERHGGRIWLESEQGKGTTFFFTLPDHDLSSTIYDWRGEAGLEVAANAPTAAKRKTRKVKEGAKASTSSGSVPSPDPPHHD